MNYRYLLTFLLIFFYGVDFYFCLYILSKVFSNTLSASPFIFSVSIFLFSSIVFLVIIVFAISIAVFSIIHINLLIFVSGRIQLSAILLVMILVRVHMNLLLILAALFNFACLYFIHALIYGPSILIITE